MTAYKSTITMEPEPVEHLELEELKRQICIAEGALKDIRKGIEAILPDHNGIRTATDAVRRLMGEYEKVTHQTTELYDRN